MRFLSGLLLLLALVVLIGDEVRGAGGGAIAWTRLSDIVPELTRLLPTWDIPGLLTQIATTPAAPVLKIMLESPAWILPAVVGALLLLLALPWSNRGGRRHAPAGVAAPAGAVRVATASDIAASYGAGPTINQAANPPGQPDAAGLNAVARAAAPATSAAHPVPPPLQTAGTSALSPRPASVVKPPAQKRAEPQLPKTQDREFLPAALEILTTPPSPVATALMLSICGAFLAALAWAYFGWLDIHAVAQGRIQPSGRSKVVQPLEPGKVVAIHVENGSRVTAGDVMLELDPTESAADREAQSRDLEASSAEAARRHTAVAAARSPAMQPAAIAFDGRVSTSVRQREDGVLSADLGQLRSQVASLRGQLAEKLATKERLRLSIAARAKLIALSKERVGMRESLDAKGSGSRALIIEALQQYETQVTQDVGERGQLLETDAAANSLERRVEEARTQFIADQTQKLAEAERKRDRLEQELLKAQSKNERTQLRAPITGSVQQLTVNSVGQVVTSGQSLATIVPIDGQIEVEAMIPNRDIGFVKAGQAAVVKVEAFPFTRYGVIDARVLKISRDAVDEREATNMSDAATAARPQGGGQPPSSRTQSLVFPAILQLNKRTILIDGEEVNLTSGMAVTVEIKTGERRAIDFVLSPLRELRSTTARER